MRIWSERSKHKRSISATFQTYEKMGENVDCLKFKINFRFFWVVGGDGEVPLSTKVSFAAANRRDVYVMRRSGCKFLE